jgi:hypothetical protein
VTGGNFLEDGSELVTGISGRSSLVFTETRLQTDLDNLADPELSSIVPAWDSSRFDAWRKAIITLGNDAQAFSEASQLYPEVLTTWKLNPKYNFQDQTFYDGFPKAEISRPCLPRQLSFMQTLKTGDFAGMTWPVYVEVKAGSFSVAGQFDGFEIFDTGVFHFPALRELGSVLKSWEASSGPGTPPFDTDTAGTGTLAVTSGSNMITGTGTDFKSSGKYQNGSKITVAGKQVTIRKIFNDTSIEVKEDFDGPSSSGESYTQNDEAALIEARDIRLNLALPADHGLSHAYFLPSDAKGQDLQSDGEITLADESVDAGRIQPSLSRKKHVDLQNLYQAWFRYNSYPNAQSSGASKAEDRTGKGDSAPLRNDLPLMKSHLERKLLEEGRIKKGGSLKLQGYLVSEYAPGTQIEALQGNDGSANLPVRGVVGMVRMKAQQGHPPMVFTEIEII